MNTPVPTIRINIDPTNPGQFFACCGLLELADRLWAGAEGWFQGTEFKVACTRGIDELLNTLAHATIDSSLTVDERRRLSTLLSKPKANLEPFELEEKCRLQELWRLERLRLSQPFDLWLDWWRDGYGERTALKTWAAKQLVAEMASRMLDVFRDRARRRLDIVSDPFFVANDDSLPFNFDSELCRTGAARDTGFSADTIKLKCSYRPLLELLAFVALQRFQPAETRGGFTYCTWSTPMPASVAAVAASGTIAPALDPRYEFGLFNRTKYMKAFLPAKLI